VKEVEKAPATWADRLVEHLVHWQIRRPWAPLAVAGAVTLVAAAFAVQLRLDTRFEALLPDDQPSVVELHRLQARSPAAQVILVVLEGDDHLGLRAMGDALVPQLFALGPELVSSAADGVQATRSFLLPRSALFLDRPDLERLDAEVDARWAWETQHAAGLDLIGDLPPPLSADGLRTEFEQRHRGRDEVGDVQATLERYPDGYYEGADGKALVVFVRSPIAGGDLGAMGRALSRVREVVANVGRSNPRFAPIRVSYAGDMASAYQEYQTVSEDLLHVGALGIALVLAVVLLYFLRIRAALVLAAAIGVGLLWTFGLTEVVLGHLNVVTSFLISIVAGNGVNVGILYQARYFEERGRGSSSAAALETAVRATWVPTLIAAVAAVASYGSLLTTQFRAFRDFGFIAASGMVLCWIAQTLVVPPLLVLLDPPELPARLRRFQMSYGRPFSWLAPKGPRVVVGLGLAIAALGVVAGVRYIADDPMQYDMGAVQNDPRANPELHHAWAVAHAVLGGSTGGMIVLTDSPAEAQELEGVLKARWAAAPANAKPFRTVHSLLDLVPDDQEAKLPLVRKLADRIAQAQRRGLFTSADWAKLSLIAPPLDLRPYGIADLPDDVARPFSEKDGRRGTIVVIEGEPSESNDLHYLLRSADSFRETHLGSGATVHGSGAVVIFADMLKAVVHDMPIAIALSLGLTLLTVALVFRRWRETAVVWFSLLTATAAVALFLYLAKVKLAFVNFAALPISFGIGVDYAVNVARRYCVDGRQSMVETLRSSGGAVVLCSLTTMLSYLALLGSHNLGIRSLGSIAAVAEASCLLAAVVLVPAVYLVLEGRSPVVPGG
jgi:predicted RND superfamily exporter protein